MKGFAISLDAVVALAFFLFAMMIITSQSYQARAPGVVYLKLLTLDAMSVLEKTGRINAAMDGNTSAVLEVIEATPKLACMSVSVMNLSGDAVTSITKSDCNETSGVDLQTSARPIIYQGGMYIVKSESWIRKEPG